MRIHPGLVVGVLFGTLVGCEPTAPASKFPAATNATPSDRAGFNVSGQTQCLPNHKGIVAPAVLHPVEEVRVAVGDRVQKGQALIKLDDDEPRADVRAKQAALKNAQISLAEARRYLAVAENARHALPDQKYHEIRVAALKAEMDERSAQATLAAAQAELEHYLVSAPIDGIITRLDVHPGMVSRPGTTVWGEILDLSELDVRCHVTVLQADRVAVGQEAEVRPEHAPQACGTGRIVFLGVVADSQSGLIPVVVRLANPQGNLRCGVPVQVRFHDAAKAEGTR